MGTFFSVSILEGQPSPKKRGRKVALIEVMIRLGVVLASSQ